MSGAGETVLRPGDQWQLLLRLELTMPNEPEFAQETAGTWGLTARGVDRIEAAARQRLTPDINGRLATEGEDGRVRVTNVRMTDALLVQDGKERLWGYVDVRMDGTVTENAFPLVAVVLIGAALFAAGVAVTAAIQGVDILDAEKRAFQAIGQTVGEGTGAAVRGLTGLSPLVVVAGGALVLLLFLRR